jgi:hypothetical protein
MDLDQINTRDQLVFPLLHLQLLFADIAAVHDSLVLAWYRNWSAWDRIRCVFTQRTIHTHFSFLNTLNESVAGSVILLGSCNIITLQLRAHFARSLTVSFSNSTAVSLPLRDLKDWVSIYANRVRAFRDSIVTTWDLIATKYLDLTLTTVEADIRLYIVVNRSFLRALDYTTVESESGDIRIVVGPPPARLLHLVLPQPGAPRLVYGPDRILRLERSPL